MHVSFFFCKQNTAYEMRISDWSSDVCSSDLQAIGKHDLAEHAQGHQCQAPAQLRQTGDARRLEQIGRASWRERVCQYVSISVVAVTLQKKYRMQLILTSKTYHKQRETHSLLPDRFAAMSLTLYSSTIP